MSGLIDALKIQWSCGFTQTIRKNMARQIQSISTLLRMKKYVGLWNEKIMGCFFEEE